MQVNQRNSCRVCLQSGIVLGAHAGSAYLRHAAWAFVGFESDVLSHAQGRFAVTQGSDQTRAPCFRRIAEMSKRTTTVLNKALAVT